MCRRLIPLFLALLFGPTARAAPLVPISQLKPSQMEIGKKAALFHVEQWKQDAKEKGMSLKTYARDVLKPQFDHTTFPMVIDPSGAYRNTDGHHRITALRKISARTGVEFEVRPKILADYRGKSFSAYANDFVNHLKLGQFTPEVEALPVVDRVRHLPDSYSDLKNNPMRSAMEVVFEKHHINGSLMRPYIEFRAGQRLIDDGLLDQLHHEKLVGKHAVELPKRLATNKHVLKTITKDLTKKDMRAYLLSEAKSPAARAELKDRLDALKD